MGKHVKKERMNVNIELIKEGGKDIDKLHVSNFMRRTEEGGGSKEEGRGKKENRDARREERRKEGSITALLKRPKSIMKVSYWLFGNGRLLACMDSSSCLWV